MLNWILERLKEKSTIASIAGGIILVASYAGITGIDAGLVEQVLLGFYSIILIATKAKKA